MTPKDYDKAITYYNRGTVKARQGDHTGAIKDYDEAIRFNPKNAVAYLDRGNAKRNQGDHTGAQKDFNVAIKLGPPNLKAS